MEKVCRELSLRLIRVTAFLLKSVGVTLPKETAEEMKVAAGDRVLIVETERGILIMKHDQAFADAMKAYEEGAREYRNALRELAKS